MLVQLPAFANKDKDQEKNSNIKNENIYRNNRWEMLHCFEIVKVKVKKKTKKKNTYKDSFWKTLTKHLQPVPGFTFLTCNFTKNKILLNYSLRTSTASCRAAFSEVETNSMLPQRKSR